MTRNCPVCGGELPEGAPGGQCPDCLIGLALEHVDRTARDGVDEGRKTGSVSSDEKRSPSLRLGGYELLERLGQGGMGVVYKARQISLDRLVAVKTLPFGAGATRQQAHRFRLEAMAAGALQHPNIVAVHEIGFEDGQHYLVMDYVEGPTLAKLTRTGPLPVHQATRYLRQIAQAVHFAHERGILHRDLKPSNVLLDPHDQPRITDFGLAKRLHSDFGLRPSDLTLTGQALGSPGYIAPEQASGRRARVGRQSDVYGLGALLYHLLTGRPPFQGGSIEQTLGQVFNQEPIPPRLLNPSVPRDLETICLKCLEKEPERRYETAQAVADELALFLKDEPIRARPVGALGRGWRWCRRKPVVAGLGAAVGLLLLTLAVGGPVVAARQSAVAEEHRRFLYAAELNTAYQAWERGNVGQALTALERHIPQGNQTDLREFTWRYVYRLTRPYRKTDTLQGASLVFGLAAARNGRLLAACGATDVVKIWDLETRKLVRDFKSGEPYVNGPINFSPDGRYFLSSGLTKGWSQFGLQIWDTTTQPDWTLVHRAGFAAARCDFSPDGLRLAAPAGDTLVLMKVGGDWAEEWRRTNQTGFIWSARFSNNGQQLVTASSDKTARVWEVATGHSRAVLRGHKAGLYEAAFSPDRRKVATASADKTVRLWDIASEREWASHAHGAEVRTLDFSPDGRFIASGGHDGLVKLWDWRSNTVRTLRGHSHVVNTVKFVLGGARLASASWDGTVRLWEVNEQAPNDVIEGCAGRSSPIAFSPEGGLLATVSSNATALLLWKTDTGLLESALPLENPEPMALQSPNESASPNTAAVSGHAVDDLVFSPDGLLAAVHSWPVTLVGTNSQRVRIELWDVRSRTMTNTLAGQAPICFSRDGHWFACQSTNEGVIQFFDRQTGRAWTSQGGFRVSPERNEFAFSPDGRWLVSCGVELVLWEAATGRRAETLLSLIRDQEPPMNTVVFTPHGRWLIASGASAEIRIWDMTRRRWVKEAFHGHLARIRDLAISPPDGTTLASGDWNGAIKFWRLEPPERPSSRWQVRELLTLSAHDAVIEDLEFSPNGDLLVSSDSSGAVRCWRAEPASTWPGRSTANGRQ